MKQFTIVYCWSHEGNLQIHKRGCSDIKKIRHHEGFSPLEAETLQAAIDHILADFEDSGNGMEQIRVMPCTNDPHPLERR